MLQYGGVTHLTMLSLLFTFEAVNNVGRPTISQITHFKYCPHFKYRNFLNHPKVLFVLKITQFVFEIYVCFAAGWQPCIM